jgi:hypothetical protein
MKSPEPIESQVGGDIQVAPQQSAAVPAVVASQPSAALPLQLPRPASQLVIPHVLPVHVATFTP